MTLSATALCTLGRAAEYADVDQTHPLLITLINAASNRIEDLLNRKILSQSYSEIYDLPDIAGELRLRQPDVTSVSFLSIWKDDVMSTRYSGTDTHARVEVTDAAVKLVSRTGSTTTTNSLTFAANVTTTALATAANLISGWTATTALVVPSAYLVQVGTISAKSNTVTLQAWDEYDGQYQTFYGPGTVRLGSPQWPTYSIADVSQVGFSGQARLDYTAGLSTVPANVELVCLGIVAGAIQQIGRDTSIASISEGDYSEDYVTSTANSATN